VLQKTRYLRLFLPFMLLCVLFFRLLTVPPSAEQQLAACFGRQLVVYGAVEPLSVRRQDGFSSAVLRCYKVYSDTELAYSGRLRVSVKGELPQAGCVVLKGTLEQLDSLRNPGGFDAASYNRVQELGGRLSKAKLLKTEPQVLWWQHFALLNKKLSERMEAAAGAEYGALLSGMVLGGSGRLDEETRELFTDNGLAHLLSVSGTHIVLLTGLLLALLQWVPLPWRKVIVITLLTAYALLCGLRPPVLRALAMSSVLLLGGSGAERGRLLCLVAALLLCLQPLWLADIGLSFGAAAGLLWLLPACQRLLPQALPAPIGEAAAVSLAAQLAVLPLEVYYFQQFSLIALVSNIVLVPVLEIAAQLALVGALLPVCGEYLLQLAAWLTAQVLTQARFFADLPYSTVVIGKLPAYCLVLYYAALFVWADFPWLQFWSNRERRCILLLHALLLAGMLAYQQYRTLPLACYFLDVGQGDCAVIVTPSQRVAIIDTGGLKNISTATRVITPFLRYLGKREADILLLSHYDFDHVGAAADLLRQLRVKKLLLPNEALTEESKRVQQEILSQAGRTQAHVVQGGERYALDDNAEIVLVDVPQQDVPGNEASTLAALQSVQGSVLFTGDMGEEREQRLQLQQYTVLKAGHHGSHYSSSMEFLEQVRPRLTVISCGRGNRYGHPHQETLERLQAIGSAVVRTDELGCIKVVFDAEGIKCYGYADLQ
jgi:competence protein ComEC